VPLEQRPGPRSLPRARLHPVAAPAPGTAGHRYGGRRSSLVAPGGCTV